MKKNDVIKVIIAFIHKEIHNLPPKSSFSLNDGVQNAEQRTSIVDTIIRDINKFSPQGSHADNIDLLINVLSDRNPNPSYPEVRLFQQWRKMSSLNVPMDTLYTADFLLSKQRAGIRLDQHERYELVNTDMSGPISYEKIMLDLVDTWRIEANAVGFTLEDWIAKPMPNGMLDTTGPAIATKVINTAAMVVQTPVASYQEKLSIIDDIALMNGISIVSGKEWRAAKMPRTKPLMVADFDFASFEEEDVERAAYILVGPASKDDIRIELNIQKTSASPSDGYKLPTSLLRLVNAAKAQSYGNAVLGIVGLQFFAPEALTLAREIANISSRVQLVEGPENFVDVLQQHINSVKGLHATTVPTFSEPGLNAEFDEAAYGGPSSYVEPALI